MPKSEWLITYSFASMHGYVTANEVVETDIPVFTSDDLFAFKQKISQGFADVAVLNFQLLRESEPRKRYYVSNYHFWDVANNPFENTDVETIYLKNEPGIDHIVSVKGVFRRVLVVIHNDVDGETILMVE